MRFMNDIFPTALLFSSDKALSHSTLSKSKAYKPTAHNACGCLHVKVTVIRKCGFAGTHPKTSAL